MKVMSPNERKQQLMVIMHAAGMTNKAIAEKLGMHINAVSVIVRSELFQAHVAEAVKELKASLVGTFLDRVDREAMPSLETIVNIRDGGVVDPQTGRLQLDAAKFIAGELYMDRKHPKITRQETDGAVHVTFDRDSLKQMFGALSEETGEVIEITATKVEVQTPQIEDLHAPKPLEAVAIDDLVEEMEADEEREASA